MTPRQAYEEDVRRRPLYPDGAPRRSWDQLSESAQISWQRSPTPREWPQTPPDRNEVS